MSTSTMLIYAVDLKKNVKTLSQQQQQHDDLFKFSKKQPVKLMTMLMWKKLTSTFNSKI